MQIVVAPDSFKECLSSAQVAAAIAEGIGRVYPEANTISIPIADGGEGTVAALVAATGGKIVPTPSVDALYRPIQSFYGILGDRKTAVIEMAAASGIELISPEERNPLIASTFGTGLLMKAVLDAGFTRIIVGIGGSATNDGGSGMAQALGFKLQDKNGNPIELGGGSLENLCVIDDSGVHPQLSKAEITVACDVRNPLLGPSGATMVYGPQKGATAEMIGKLEENMSHFCRKLQEKFGINISEVPGAGAAGGLGAGMLAFCNAKITSGFETVSKLTNLEKHISGATLVFTAEGKIDAQTANGKTISGVAQLARKYDLPVIALAGVVAGSMKALYSQGVTAIFSIAQTPVSIEESKARAAELLADKAEQLMLMVKKAKLY
ncbi:MAG TPA: glycerate kinase [Prolixibacteraceae bacterium]|nr:glycerate kinase [Prolixibacteraceae bacterium]